ncbi:hypothetical protein FS749_009439 [Ceratobasidium sp. UAMH 11750]|nr:hypothetical protein FS749_009439 [Ceratobasidium sp. UAMH 11750]
MDYAQLSPFKWKHVKEPVKLEVQIDGVFHAVALRAYLINKDTPEVEYLKLPYLYQDYVIRVVDLINRVDDRRYYESLASDLKHPQRIQCRFWTMDGRAVSDMNPNSSRLGHAHWQACLSSGYNGAVDKAYRDQWVLCFNFAVRIAGNQKSRIGTYNLLNRFYRPIIPPPQFYAPGVLHTFPLYLLAHPRLQGLTSAQLNDAIPEAAKNAGDVSATWILDSQKHKYVRLSANPLGLYSTWVERDHLPLLVKDQTVDGVWPRVLPITTQVGDFNEQLLSQGSYKYSTMLSSEKSSLLQWPGQNLRYYSRRSTRAIMGGSANEWATDTLQWKSPVFNSRAEWLHLVAHQFDHGGDRFSNMIFGTKECNTDMMRAEATVRQLLFSGRTYAVEVGIVVKRGLKEISMLGGRESTTEVTWLRPGPDGKKIVNYPHWLASELEYTITSFRPAEGGTWVPDTHTTTFHPFSCQRPFQFEHQLDQILLEKYLETFEIPINVDLNQKFENILENRKPPYANCFEWGDELDGADGEWTPEKLRNVDVSYPDFTPSEAEEDLRGLEDHNPNSLSRRSKNIKKPEPGTMGRVSKAEPGKNAAGKQGNRPTKR